MNQKSIPIKSGAPQKEIDWQQFEQLCGLQCTQSEIASVLRIHPDTLRDRAKAEYSEDYSTLYKKFSENGKCSLRRNQFVLSKKNASMAIWLGKQWLGQRDKEEEERKSQQIILKVEPNGLGTGINISAEKLSDSPHQSA